MEAPMTPEEYDLKLKEMEAKMQQERQAIIEEFQNAQSDKELQKRQAHEIMLDNAQFAAPVTDVLPFSRRSALRS